MDQGITINRTSMSAMPSIGVLSRFNEYNTIDTYSDTSGLVNFLQSTLGDTSYFNSSMDRYSAAFGRTIEYHNNEVAKVNRELKIALGAVSGNDEIRICANERGLRNLPPVMMPIMMSYQPIYDLWLGNHIQGWGDYTREEMKIEKRKWDRLLNQNGVSRYNQRTSKEDDTSYFRWIYKTGDPDLTLADLDAIEETQEYIDQILAESDLDPTDLDEVRT